MKSVSMLLLLLAAACGESEGSLSGTAATTTSGGGGAVTGAGGGEAGGTAQGGEGGSEGGAGGSGGGPLGELVCDGPGARFVTDVVSVSYGTGQDFGQQAMPDIVYGPPLGGGQTQGSLDVVSLGNGGEIVVAFAGNGISDGTGVDFVVFENAFEAGGSIFAELATVSVSDDGITWHEFPCSAIDEPYGSCAGAAPVELNGDPGPIDPATCGGDAYDLADLGLTRARLVRITDRADLDGFDGVFDLDAVGIVHGVCE